MIFITIDAQRFVGLKAGKIIQFMTEFIL